MLLAIDIGNSSIKFGVFDGEILQSKFSVATKSISSVDDISSGVGLSLDRRISAALVCSVVPEVEEAMANFLRLDHRIKPIFVRNNFDFGLTIKYEPLEAVGTDRLVNAFAVAEKYGTPSIVVSFGTATTIDAINEKRELLGGLIAPGMATMAKALHLNTAKLPEITIKKPDNIISRTTETSIHSGVFYGQVGLVESSISRMKNEIGQGAKVIATGGFASMIAADTDGIDIVDENLLLDGLRLLYSQNAS